jgi:hypothetical protein
MRAIVKRNCHERRDNVVDYEPMYDLEAGEIHIESALHVGGKCVIQPEHLTDDTVVIWCDPPASAVYVSSRVMSVYVSEYATVKIVRGVRGVPLPAGGAA